MTLNIILKAYAETEGKLICFFFIYEPRSRPNVLLNVKLKLPTRFDKLNCLYAVVLCHPYIAPARKTLRSGTQYIILSFVKIVLLYLLEYYYHYRHFAIAII